MWQSETHKLHRANCDERTRQLHDDPVFHQTLNVRMKLGSSSCGLSVTLMVPGMEKENQCFSLCSGKKGNWKTNNHGTFW